jgi:DNA-binding transcriptional MocR family regulator
MHTPQGFMNAAGFDLAGLRFRWRMRLPTTTHRPRFSTGSPRPAASSGQRSSSRSQRSSRRGPAAAICLEHVDWSRRTAELRAVYGTSKHPMLDGLAAIRRAGSASTRPPGGAFAWAELPEGWSTSAPLEPAGARGIRFIPGTVFIADSSDDCARRLPIANRTLASVPGRLSRPATSIAVAPVGAA